VRQIFEKLRVILKCVRVHGSDSQSGMWNQRFRTPPEGTTASMLPPAFAPIPGAGRVITGEPGETVPPMIQSGFAAPPGIPIWVAKPLVAAGFWRDQNCASAVF